MATKSKKRQSKRVGWIDVPSYDRASDSSFPGPDRPCGQSGCEFKVRFSNTKGWHHVSSVRSDRHHLALPGSEDSYWDGDLGQATDEAAKGG